MAQIKPQSLTVAVLVSAAEHPVTHRLGAHEPDRQALAVTQAWLPAAGQLHVLGVGPMPAECQRTFYAQGIDAIRRVPDEAQDEAWLANIGQLVAECDVLVLSARLDGCVNPRGLDGLLPYRLAAAQQRRLIDNVVAVVAEADGLLVTQALAQGARRRLRVAEAVVLVMSPGLKVNVAYAAYRAQQQAVDKKGEDAVDGVAEQSEVPFKLRLQPLRPQRQLSGHQRLLAAIGGDSSGMTVVIDTGTAQEKAQQIMAYLKAQGVLTHLQRGPNHESD
ncbi:MAG: hypothetical protein KA214_01655 [Neisseriaceae bacterium]|nr:hypothetical protein [Neisseriaceae bacterium]